MANTYLVKIDVRPTFHMTVRNEYLKEMIGYLKESGLYFYSNKGKIHSELWGYRRKHLKNVILFLSGKKFDKARFYVWVDGKIFGYPEHEIEKYLNGNQILPINSSNSPISQT